MTFKRFLGLLLCGTSLWVGYQAATGMGLAWWIGAAAMMVIGLVLLFWNARRRRNGETGIDDVVDAIDVAVDIFD